MIKNTTIVFFCLVCSTSATGADKDNEKIGRKTHSGKEIVDPGQVVLSDSSEANRQNKKFLAVAELVGFTPLASSGLTGGYYVNPDTIVDLSYTYGKYDLFFFSLAVTTVAMRYKQFVGNSFYWRAGGGYRHYESTTTIEPFTGSDELDSTGTATSIGFDGAIGNQWQWENFTIGCDWVGLFIPVSSSHSLDEPDGADEDDYNDQDESMDRLAKETSLQLLRFYLGVSF